MKNKIIYLSNGYKGGATRFIEQHINYTYKKKFSIFLIDDNPNKTYINFKNLVNIKTIKSSIFKKKRKTQNIIKNIIKNKPDNVTFFTTNYLIYLYYYFFFKRYQKLNSKFVMTLHSGVFNLNFKTIIGALFFSLIVRKIGLLFYGSSSAKDWWISRFPWMQNIKSEIIHNGIEQKRFKKKKLKKKINVSFVGRVEMENNPKLFVKVATEMNKINKNYNFHIYGMKIHMFEAKTNFKGIVCSNVQSHFLRQ